MAQYLIQRGSNCVFMASPELLKRDDMRPYDPVSEKYLAGPEPKAQLEQLNIPTIESFGDVQPEVKIEKTFDITEATTETISLDAIKAELEAIDDPEEMIAHVLGKYGLRLNKTMKKTTMIERTIQAVKDWKGLS